MAAESKRKTHSFPKLFKLRKDDKYHTIVISVQEVEDNKVNIITLHGIEDGQKQEDLTTIESGKNIGKKNETTVWEQAFSEAESKWKKKLDENYTQGKDETAKFSPMLAYSFLDRYESELKKYKKPLVHIQPKLDGVRAYFTWDVKSSTVKAYSRKNKDISAPLKNITEPLRHLLSLNQNLILDGEIYSLDAEVNIQAIAGYVNTKEYEEEKHKKLCVIFYDAFDYSYPDLSYINRFVNMVPGWSKSLHSCKTIHFITDKAINKETYTELSDVNPKTLLTSADTYLAKAIKNGFEGIMIRFADDVYGVSKRVASLLKYKKQLDAEYEITDVIAPTTGREAGTAIFVCKAKDKTFNAPSVGTRDERKEIFENKDKYIGKQLVVQYQDLTDDGIPRFPKGLRIREED